MKCPYKLHYRDRSWKHLIAFFGSLEMVFLFLEKHNFQCLFIEKVLS